jgi:lipopolysaccharide/colanic/teichoic acid biosynthesis glycosyltransferase
MSGQVDAVTQSQAAESGERVRRPPPRPSIYQRIFKPAFDRLVSVSLLVVLSPVMIAIAVAIRLTSPGPVLFVQTRIGQHGDRIRVIRFRSVDVDSELWGLTVAHAPVEVDLGSAGLSRIGRFLLRTRLDRLPQLINVLRSEMSLVGPRPPLSYEVERYRPVDWIRLRVKPGLTCLWQIDGHGGSDDAAMSSDYRYVTEISLRLDLAILARTAAAVISGRVPRH